MCDPVSLLVGGSLALSGVQAMGTIAGGKAQAQGLRDQAHQMETRRIDIRTRTSQASRDRATAFSDALSTNILAAAISGSSLGSFGAVLDENARRAGQDVTRIQMQGEIEDADARFQAADLRAQAKAVRRSSLVSGLLGFARAGIQAGISMPGGSGVSKSIGSSLFKA